MNTWWSFRNRLSHVTWEEVFATVVTLFCFACVIASIWLFVMINIETKELIEVLKGWGE